MSRDAPEEVAVTPSQAFDSHRPVKVLSHPRTCLAVTLPYTAPQTLWGRALSPHCSWAAHGLSGVNLTTSLLTQCLQHSLCGIIGLGWHVQTGIYE